MTGLEVYAYYLAPLVMLGAGLGMVAITRIIESRERRVVDATDRRGGR